MEKKYSNSRLPFEIIEIGAVKMNEQREVVDVFQRLVKPQYITGFMTAYMK